MKAKKQSRKVKTDENGTAEIPATEIIAVTGHAELATDMKPQKRAKVPQLPASDLSAKEAKKSKKTTWPTQEMTQAVNKVLSIGDSLTADGVNGILERSSEEDVEVTTANEVPDTSMQAEAQRTVDKEMADEAATEDDSDDQGAALLTGFDSDGDDTGQDEGLDPANMADLDLNKQQRKKLRQAARKGSKEGPGAVYVGRVPRGFYETQMRQYFSQFGNITNLRLSRNKTTGASKHFAFVEFESNEVAKIVAQTMDNYLMFGHILKCKYAPSESLHPDTWKGANKRFKKVPYNKIEKRKLEEPKTKDQWAGNIAREQEKREKKLSKAQAMGYDYELPQIQGVDAALERKKLAQEEDLKAIKPAAEVQEPAGSLEPPAGVPKDAVALKKRGKGLKKVKGEAVTESVTESVVLEAAADSQPAVSEREETAKTMRKAEAASTAAKHEPINPVIAETSPAAAAPQKKANKAKKVASTSEAIVPHTNIEAQTEPITTATNRVEPKKSKKGVVAGINPFEASSSTALPEAEPPKFAFHPDEIAELTKSKPKKQKKSKSTDHAAAQMQLNAELNEAVEPVKDQTAESDTEIAATTAVLPTPGDVQRKTAKKAKSQAKMDKRGSGILAESSDVPKKVKKTKKAVA